MPEQESERFLNPLTDVVAEIAGSRNVYTPGRFYIRTEGRYDGPSSRTINWKRL